MVHGYKVFWHIRSILGWSQSVLAILPYNPLICSSRLYGKFFLDKTGQNMDLIRGLQCIEIHGNKPNLQHRL